MLSLVNLTLAYGGPPLLDQASMDILAGDRLALIGRNGAGKSSLLKIISRDVKPDAGERTEKGKPRVATLPQHIPDYPDKPVETVLKERLPHP